MIDCRGTDLDDILALDHGVDESLVIHLQHFRFSYYSIWCLAFVDQACDNVIRIRTENDCD